MKIGTSLNYLKCVVDSLSFSLFLFFCFSFFVPFLHSNVYSVFLEYLRSAFFIQIYVNIINVLASFFRWRQAKRPEILSKCQ